MSKFCISFMLTNLGDAMLRSQELILDLELTSGAASMSEATTEDYLLAEHPDTVGDAHAMTERSHHLEHTATAWDAVSEQDPATLNGRGSFNSDQKNGYGLQWLSIDEFEEWCQSEEHMHTIKLRVVKVEHSVVTLGRSLWMTKHVYQCMHQWVGQRADQRTHPEQQCKIPRKGTSCCCQIIIKCYPHTPIVLGQYVVEYNHSLSADNLTYAPVGWHTATDNVIANTES